MQIDDAAVLTHVSVDLFSRLENGKEALRLDKLLLVLDAMGLCLILEPKSSPIVQKLLQQNKVSWMLTYPKSINRQNDGLVASIQP